MSINVTRSSMPPFEEYCEEIRGLWDSHWLTNMGTLHKKLEAELKRYLGCEQLTLFTNGHLALENVIAAMDFPKGGEVITTPRAQAPWIVTEYGAVSLSGKPAWQRAEAIISVAHPDFREELIHAAEAQRIWRRSNKR